MELKKLDWNPKYRKPAIEFTRAQTKAMKKLTKLPHVVVFGEKPERYYLLTPENVAKKLSTRMKYLTMWVTEDKLLEIEGIRTFNIYEALLDACIDMFKRALGC